MYISKISDNSWHGILKVQEEAYTGLPPEEINVLKSKWKVSPKTCFVFQTIDEEIVGYLLAHSWNSNVPPKLFEELPNKTTGDILYLHDLAVINNARGMGVGKQLSNKLIETAKLQKFKRVLLVAVQESERYWFHLGFREIHNVPICVSYGSDAKLMFLDLHS